MDQIDVNIYEFKTHFSRLLHDLESGKAERIIVKRRNVPVGTFVLKNESARETRYKLGALKGLMDFDKDLFDSGDEEIAELFYGSEE